MTGSITKYLTMGSNRPKWRYRIYAGKDDQGRKLYVGKAGFVKQSDAAEDMRQRIHEMRSRGVEMPKPQKDETLGEWLQFWLNTYAPDRCQPKTLERYRELAGYILESSQSDVNALARTELGRLTHVQVELALHLLLRGQGKRRKHLSVRTVRHVAGVLSVALNKAFRLGRIETNPMLRVELPKVSPSDARSLTPEEILVLRDACRNDWTFVLIETALATGARRGELLALQWSDLDFGAGNLTISKSLEQTTSGIEGQET